MKRSPMKGFVFTAAAFLLAGVPAGTLAAQEITGSWESRVWESERTGQSRVQLSLEVRERGDGRWNHGFSTEAGQLEGVALSELEGDGDVEFRLVREAGVVTFRGRVRSGRGDGDFSFEPSADYRSAMAGLGYPGLDPRDQFSFALFDITTAFVTELGSLGYRGLPREELKRFAIHGVRPEFIRAMNDLGYAAIPAEDLVRLRIHGVSPDWVRRVRAALSSS